MWQTFDTILLIAPDQKMLLLPTKDFCSNFGCKVTTPTCDMFAKVTATNSHLKCTHLYL